MAWPQGTSAQSQTVSGTLGGPLSAALHYANLIAASGDSMRVDVEGVPGTSVLGDTAVATAEDFEMRYESGGEGSGTSSDSSSSSWGPAPPSPTPSFVKIFGWCTCDGCRQRAQENTFYPPDIREKKLQQYEEWNATRLRKIEQERINRKERYATHLVLKRQRAQDVVGEMFGLDDLERRVWDEESYGRWWGCVEEEVERRANLGYESSYSPQ